MKFSILYLQTWLTIKRKQLLNMFPAKENSFTKFAIVCAPRSGSTWLHTLLNSHPLIMSYGEILREQKEKNPIPLSPLGKLVFHPHHSSILAVGLKIFYEYETERGYARAFQELINDPSIRIIHLVRNNKQAQFESLLRAQQSQQWSSGIPAVNVLPVTIDPEEFEHYRHALMHTEKEITRLFQHHALITIPYETLRDDQVNTCELIQNFLNIPPRSLFSLLRRQSA